MADRIQAIYRPRTADVRIIRGDGQSLDIPADQAEELREALGAALGVPAIAEAMAAQNCWTAH